MPKKKENETTIEKEELQELVSEEAHEAEQVQEELDDIDKELSKIKEVTQDGSSEGLDAVESERQKLVAYYKKQNRWSIIVIVIVLICVIGGFILVIIAPKTEEGTTNWAYMGPGIALLGIAVIGIVLQYAIGRRKMPKAVEKYANMAIDIFNAYNFSNHLYSQVLYDEFEKIVPSEILSDRIYYDVVDTKSQAVVHGGFDGCPFRVGNLAVMVKGENKKANDTAFLGRYITFPNSVKLEGRIILNYKGEKPIDTPTDTFDLKKLEDTDALTVYGAEGVDYKKILPHKFLAALEEIKIEGSLLNMNVVIWQGHTAVYLTYVDAYVSIPYNDPVNKEYYDKGRDDILAVLTALKIIDK